MEVELVLCALAFTIVFTVGHFCGWNAGWSAYDKQVMKRDPRGPRLYLC
ncbi:MAG: hypothetical protein LC808_03425 [Actinobacteria bacterium]|nr:hypothetical protein [Actinomycetota bacterium]